MRRIDAAHLSALASLTGIGPARLRLLLDAWEPAEAWTHVRKGTIGTSRSVANGLAGQFDKLRRSWRRQAAAIEPESLLAHQEDLGIVILGPDDPGFPIALRNDIEPPAVLWALGDPSVATPPAVAIVGTRRCTRYGHDVARHLGEQLSAAGVTVVSGLALGIDAAAHAGALAAGTAAAPPVAVVGTGLDVIYPSRNRSLWGAVAERGVLFSEAPPGATAEPWRFPARNRLIAALSSVVVVVESAERGGSLYTVDEAMARDVEVRAVPGPISTATSTGTNRLIADGAAPVLSASELLESLGIDGPRPDPGQPEPGDPEEAAMMRAVTGRAATLNELADMLGLPLERVALVATRLEANGSLSRTGGWYERGG